METKTAAQLLADSRDPRPARNRKMFYNALLAWRPEPGSDSLLTVPWLCHAATEWAREYPESVSLRSGTSTVGPQLFADHFGPFKPHTKFSSKKGGGRLLAESMDHIAEGATGLLRLVREVKELTFEPMLAGAVSESTDLATDQTSRALALLAALSGWAATYPHVAVLDEARPPSCFARHFNESPGEPFDDALSSIGAVVVRVTAAKGGRVPLAGLNVARAAVRALHLSTGDRALQRTRIAASLAEFMLTHGKTHDENDAHFIQYIQTVLDRLS